MLNKKSFLKTKHYSDKINTFLVAALVGEYSVCLQKCCVCVFIHQVSLLSLVKERVLTDYSVCM